MLKFLEGLSVMAGTIIGVGIFGLPYAALRAGFFVVLFFFVLIGIISVFNHLLYGEVCLKTKGRHRLPGYAEIYLGPWGKRIASFSIIFGIFGALLAYLIVGGSFLESFFVPLFGGNNLIYTLSFFIIGSFLVFKGIKTICHTELVLLVVFFILLAIFFTKGLPFIEVSNFTKVDWKFFTFPYGIILFSLWGLTTIPEAKDIVGRDKKTLKKVIASSLILASLTYVFFVITVLGVSGNNTSREAISGFVATIGNNVANLGFLFGIITCFTSFIALGLVLKKIFWYDMGLSKNLAWFVACFSPLLMFLLGFKNFLDVIGLAGAVGVGIAGTVVVLIYKKVLEKEQRKMHTFLYCLPAFMLLGIFFEIFYFVFAK